ncbi:MAG: zinc ribbon domain-containing protein [Pirellulaceae bacterium]|jgi:putative FmdB family regulatory protein|nr:zinc ribbon domain-containing protein [Pirellulaceae bacterium]MDP7019694.1 zinc ribbon domain-containing protein [Pirellulaceae bacterium]
MPLYEYACDKCDSEFELLIRADDTPACPDCGNEQVEKLFSAPFAPSKGLKMAPPESCGRPACGGGRCMGMET